MIGLGSDSPCRRKDTMPSEIDLGHRWPKLRIIRFESQARGNCSATIFRENAVSFLVLFDRHISGLSVTRLLECLRRVGWKRRYPLETVSLLR